MRRTLQGKNPRRSDMNGGDDFAFMFVKPTLTEEQQRQMEKNIKDGKNNQGSLLASGRERFSTKLPTQKPVKFKVGTNMQALLNADQKKMTVAEKQEYLKGKYKAKHDIGDYKSLKKAKRNPKSQGQTSKVPPVSLRKVCAPQLKIDLKKFAPEETKKTEWQTKILRKVIHESVVLKNKATKTEDRLIAAMKAIKLKPGQILSRQGEVDEKDDKYYVVESGKIEFQVDGVTVDTAEAGTAFNEERLLYRHANNATIKASEDTSLLELDQQTFRGIIQQEEIKAQEEKKKEETKKEALVKSESKPKPKFEREKKKKGKKKTRTIAGEWDLSDSSIFQEQEQARSGVKKHASSKEDLEFIRLLGEGQFGEVWLVAATLPEFKEKQEYALKMQDITEDELREDPTDAIWKEITALKVVSHPFIVNLVHVYESDTSIDMLLGLIRGTELWDEVHREEEPDVWVEGFSEARARFYSCVLIDTLAFLHKHEFCYRDFKPENVMIDEDGYPILVDFGFAKHVAKGEKTFTFCGTPNYVAPEIITNSGHDRNVDYWALGVVICEMVTGENPFFYEGMEQFALYQAITDEAPYDMGDNYTEEVVSLIHMLLEKDATKRLGSNHPHDILEHKWFRGTPDLSEYRAKKVAPPPLIQETISFEVESEDDESTASGASLPDFDDKQKDEPLKSHFSAGDEDIFGTDDGGLDELDLFKEEEKPKPKIKLVPFKVTNKGSMKGYYAKEKTEEEKANSKVRRDMLSGTLEDIEE